MMGAVAGESLAFATGSTGAPELAHQVDTEVAAPQPPSFGDVVQAQRWALHILQTTEEEANRRGSRGSRAWEDTWRDALWTLAVQKRCVEMEARKSRAATAAVAASRSASSSPPTPPPAGQLPGGQVLLEGVLWPQQSSPAAAGVASGPPPGSPCLAAPACSSSSSAAAAALRREAATLERACLEPVHQRLHDLDQRLHGLAASLRTATVAGAAGSQRGGDGLRCRGSVGGGGGPAAGPLPAGHERSREASVAELHTQNGILELERRLADSAAQADREAAHRQEAEVQREQAERRLRHAEVDGEALRAQLRHAEVRLDGEEHRQREAESQWRRRHAALQRQLRRMEHLLGEGRQHDPSGGDGELGVGRAAEVDAWNDSLVVGADSTISATSDISSTLELWRQARKLTPGRSS